MSGFRFAAYVMGFMHLETIVRSPRIRGLSQQMFAGKGWLRQAATLTVLQVLRIHDVLDSEAAHPYDRAVAAYLLIGIYGRCRHSDLLHLHGCVHDWDEEGGFIELRAAHLKTARANPDTSEGRQWSCLGRGGMQGPGEGRSTSG